MYILPSYPPLALLGIRHETLLFFGTIVSHRTPQLLQTTQSPSWEIVSKFLCMLEGRSCKEVGYGFSSIEEVVSEWVL